MFYCGFHSQDQAVLPPYSTSAKIMSGWASQQKHEKVVCHCCKQHCHDSSKENHGYLKVQPSVTILTTFLPYIRILTKKWMDKRNIKL